ncbi:MAG: Jag N-terminal domain-containing protein [Clostridia bacterium]|nr:Jag N-terminal domain-containing protein [Clostridia bacterium]
MKTEFRVTAKTVSEAYTKAIGLYSSLGEISYEIISEGKKGFLGIFGRADAVIKVIVDDGREEKKPKNQTQGEQKAPEKQKNTQKNQAQSNPKNNQQKQKPMQSSAKNEQKAEQKSEQRAEVKAAQRTEVKSEAKANDKAAEKASLKEENINVTVEEKTLAMNFLKSFIRDIGMSCEVKGDLTLNENGFVSRVITIEGEGAASLIGHRGDMLDALQYLANLCLARKSEGEHKEYVKVVLDIENYREKREQTLRNLARRMAEKALKYQRNVVLEPMNPYERMIIHSEIQSIEGVSTHSVGYDENRKIVITCENKKRRTNNN